MTAAERLTWHPCPGVNPDGRTFGYVCTNCGRQLRKYGQWFRHTNLVREDGRAMRASTRRDVIR